MFESALILSFALLIDQLIGEPRRFHPLVGFGWCANQIERLLNCGNFLLFKGFLSLLLLMLPLALVIYLLDSYFNFDSYWFIDVVIVYLAIGRKSLIQHAQAVIKPLKESNILLARKQLSFIVSRDTQALDEKGIIKATIETVVENSSDAIYAVLFWYLIAGIPGVIFYRLVNTLDAMWGYKNKRFKSFGWSVAKLDDVLNWMPARLTVFSFSAFNRSSVILKTAFKQGAECRSPNAGPVMAAGACSLNIKLGGDAFYQGQKIAKPILGFDKEVEIEDITRSIKLVNKTTLLWLITIFALSIFVELIK